MDPEHERHIEGIADIVVRDGFYVPGHHGAFADRLVDLAEDYDRHFSPANISTADPDTMARNVIAQVLFSQEGIRQYLSDVQERSEAPAVAEAYGRLHEAVTGAQLHNNRVKAPIDIERAVNDPGPELAPYIAEAREAITQIREAYRPH